MRILHVIQELGVGGAERVVVALVLGAQAAGHECAVVAAPGPVADELRVRRYDLPMLERSARRVPAAAWAVDRALRAFEPDVVHAHNPGVGLPVALATVRGRRLPSLVSVHGVPDADYASAARLLRLAGLPVVSCGPGVTAGLAEAGLEPVETVVNGVSPPPPAADRATLVQALGADPANRLVLVVGRLAAVKNQELAIRAIVPLHDVTLVLVGDGPMRAELESAARRAGVEDRVAFAGLRPDARSLMGAADVVALTSRSEGLPLVALETLAAGTPLVATSVRGIRELLHDGEDAVLVPDDDTAALSAALRRVLDDRELRSRLVQSGRDLAARHSESEMVGRFLALYMELGRR